MSQTPLALLLKTIGSVGTRGAVLSLQARAERAATTSTARLHRQMDDAMLRIICIDLARARSCNLGFGELQHCVCRRATCSLQPDRTDQRARKGALEKAR